MAASTRALPARAQLCASLDRFPTAFLPSQLCFLCTRGAAHRHVHGRHFGAISVLDSFYLPLQTATSLEAGALFSSGSLGLEHWVSKPTGSPSESCCTENLEVQEVSSSARSR